MARVTRSGLGYVLGEVTPLRRALAHVAIRHEPPPIASCPVRDVPCDSGGCARLGCALLALIEHER